MRCGDPVARRAARDTLTGTVVIHAVTRPSNAGGGAQSVRLQYTVSDGRLRKWNDDAGGAVSPS